MDAAGDVTTFDADEGTVVDVASFDGTIADTPVDAGAPSTLPRVPCPAR